MYPAYNIVISDILGQKIFERTANSETTQLSIAGQLSGIYFIQITRDNRFL